ncbi:MAG: carbohydrate-binding protein [Salinivirgaceae bacterium]|jgi:hypothetical protein|nr:carbohydrate-binding protein [Salinivirgaceae bacterium]
MRQLKFIQKAFIGFLFITQSLSLSSQEISPMLVGTNVWYIDPSDQVWDLTEQAGVGSLRIGGHAYDDNLPSKSQLLDWVTRIQAMGGEPIMQVSQYKTASIAADLVKYFNIDLATGKPIKYWNIGNEPWLQAERPAVTTAGALVETYFKPIAEAMKEVDPTIKIYGPDYCYYIDEGIDDLFGGKNDIAGKIPGKDYYYCDGISWHRYPQDGNINLAYGGIEDFKGSIIKCKAKVDEVNALHNRTGDDAIVWGIGEYNAKGGPQVHTWENGQMFGGVLGLCMKYEATYATSWSMFENGGNREGTDFSFIDGANMTPRPSYRHMQMIAKYFKGTYVDGTSSLDDIIVFGSKNADTISVMIMNRANNAASYTIHLNSSDTSNNQVQLNIDADSSMVYSDVIPGLATQTLVFKNGEILKIEYTNTHFENEMAPTESIIIKASTLPGAPTGLTSPSSTYKSVELQWEIASTDTVNGFQIERKKNETDDFKLIGIVGNRETSFTDNDLEALTSYTYRVKAFNTAGESAYSNEVTATTKDIPPHKAYNGPHSIPGKIQIEDFDDNDEGISYHDSEPANQGGAYRSDQGVDIETCTDDEGGYNIGYVETGEWLDYSIENITEGTYDIAIRVASNQEGTKKIKTYLNEEYLGLISPENTGGWQNWETLYLQDIEITGGNNQVLQLKFEGSGFNLNWLEINTDLVNGIKINDNSNIKGFYNQSKKCIYVNVNESSNVTTISLFDTLGKKHFHTTQNNFTSGEFAVIAHRGMYILNIQSEHGSLSKKVLIN